MSKNQKITWRNSVFVNDFVQKSDLFDTFIGTLVARLIRFLIFLCCYCDVLISFHCCSWELNVMLCDKSLFVDSYQWIKMQCIIKHLLNSVCDIPNYQGLGKCKLLARLIAFTSVLIILHIAKTEFDNYILLLI
jgi:hypothetical protein